MNKNDAVKKKTDDEWISALYTEGMTDQQKYDKLCTLFFMIHNSGYRDSMASDLSSGNPSSQALWWEEVCEHEYAIEKECERLQDRLECYEGETDEEGLPHGKGTKYHLDGSRYEGEWNHGKKDGFGIEYTTDGTKRYEGGWKNNNRCGYGVLFDIYTNIRYEGFFEDRSSHDQYSLSREKKIVITCPGGEVVEGPLDNGRYRFTYPNGDILECEEFLLPTQSSGPCPPALGKGIYRYADGGILVGRWAYGKPGNDDCVYTYPDGKKEIWKHKFGELRERIPFDE